MASSMISPNTGDMLGDQEIWDSLQQAIAASSGFQCWQQEQMIGGKLGTSSPEERVRCYLRQTLETLAY